MSPPPSSPSVLAPNSRQQEHTARTRLLARYDRRSASCPTSATTAFPRFHDALRRACNPSPRRPKTAPVATSPSSSAPLVSRQTDRRQPHTLPSITAIAPRPRPPTILPRTAAASHSILPASSHRPLKTRHQPRMLHSSARASTVSNTRTPSRSSSAVVTDTSPKKIVSRKARKKASKKTKKRSRKATSSNKPPPPTDSDSSLDPTPLPRRQPPRAARPEFTTLHAAPAPPTLSVQPTARREDPIVNHALVEEEADLTAILPVRPTSLDTRPRMRTVPFHQWNGGYMGHYPLQSQQQYPEIIDVDEFLPSVSPTDVVNLISDDEESDDDVPLLFMRKRRRVERRSNPRPPIPGNGETDFDDVAIVSHVVRGAGVPLDASADATDASLGNDAGVASAAAKPSDDELMVVGERRGMQALVDLPHMRFQCGKIPFRNGTRSKSCPMCYCFVCDALVRECSSWSKHCRATDQSDKWKQAREDAREKRRRAEEMRRLREKFVVSLTRRRKRIERLERAKRVSSTES